MFDEAEFLSHYPIMYLPCGGVAIFDEGSGIGYRCEVCNAVVGSIGQPQYCKDEDQFWKGWKKMGGKGWNYLGGYGE